MIAFIRSLALAYERFALSKSFLLKSFLIELPHIIPTLILIFFFPEQWIGLLLTGILLPDSPTLLHLVLHKLTGYQHLYFLKGKLFSHLTLLTLAILLFHEQYLLLGISCILHLFIDWLGF